MAYIGMAHLVSGLHAATTLPHEGNNKHLLQTLICYKLSSKFETNLLEQRYLKNTSFAHSFSSSRSVFCGGYVPVLGRNNLWVANTMDKSIRTSAFRDGNSDEHVRVLEQEAFIAMDGSITASSFRDGNSDENVQVLEQEAFIDDGPSEFRPKFLLHDVESTLNRLSKWIITALSGAFILWRHDAEALWFAAGSILNAMLSLSLKQILNQKRPSTLKSDPGMPSSHAQSIFFTVMFIIFSSFEGLGINEFTITSSGLALAFGSYFSYLRVSQKLHTVSQVVVGAVIGSICSFLWYWQWNAFTLDAFLSSLWVRIIVVLGSAGICIGFVLHVIRHWLKDE